MASLERRLLLRFIHLFDDQLRNNQAPAEDNEAEDEPLPGAEESALAILLSLHGDVVSLEGSVYRREGLSVVVYRDVPCLDPDATAEAPKPEPKPQPMATTRARSRKRKRAGLVSQPRKRK